jgi:abortive infection bacteriophage resistance protein
MNTPMQLVYTKPPLSIDAQVKLLRDRGLVIEDEIELRYFLKNVNYYHLSIYFKLFQTSDVFHSGTTFADIVRIYTFDNKLRFLLLELLERVEKSFKSRTAYNLSTTTKLSHPHLAAELFRDLIVCNELQQMFIDEVSRSKEISIVHYLQTYTNPTIPPIWTIVEILSFGQTVKFVKSLRREHRNIVARTFGADEQFVLSWMHSLSSLRNNCAHHSRLWDREHIFTPRMDHRKYISFFTDNKKLFNHLIVLQIVLNEINPTSSWLNKLDKLIVEFGIDVSHMGFPVDWHKRITDLQKIK